MFEYLRSSIQTCKCSIKTIFWSSEFRKRKIRIMENDCTSFLFAQGKVCFSHVQLDQWMVGDTLRGCERLNQRRRLNRGLSKWASMVSLPVDTNQPLLTDFANPEILNPGYASPMYICFFPFSLLPFINFPPLIYSFTHCKNRCL